VTALVAGAVALGSTTAMAAVPLGQNGDIGTFVIIDSETKPGVTCTYDAGGPGAQGNDIDIIEARGPRVFARDRTPNQDSQTVSVRLIFQRSVNEGGTGGWVKAGSGPLIKKTAYDDKPARFARQSWLVPVEEDYHFRTLAIIKWLRPGGSSKVEGSTKQRYVYYQVESGGPSSVEMDRCLPEP
jgi:hypothetical protein